MHHSFRGFSPWSAGFFALGFNEGSIMLGRMVVGVCSSWDSQGREGEEAWEKERKRERERGSRRRKEGPKVMPSRPTSFH